MKKYAFGKVILLVEGCMHPAKIVGIVSMVLQLSHAILVGQ